LRFVIDSSVFGWSSALQEEEEEEEEAEAVCEMRLEQQVAACLALSR